MEPDDKNIGPELQLTSSEAALATKYLGYSPSPDGTESITNANATELEQEFDSREPVLCEAEDMATIRTQCRSCSRSVMVRVRNTTPLILSLRGAPELGHGIWLAEPPTTIQPYSQAIIATGSKGMMSGTEARVRYGVEGSSTNLEKSNTVGCCSDEDPNLICDLHWDNPVMTKVSAYATSLPKDYA